MSGMIKKLKQNKQLVVVSFVAGGATVIVLMGVIGMIA